MLSPTTKAAVLRQGGKERPVGGAHLPEPGAFAGAATQLPHEQHGEEFGVGALRVAGTATPARGVGTAKACFHPIVDEAEDDQEQVDATEIGG
jgi:hypothetical protein